MQAFFFTILSFQDEMRFLLVFFQIFYNITDFMYKRNIYICFLIYWIFYIHQTAFETVFA